LANGKTDDDDDDDNDDERGVCELYNVLNNLISIPQAQEMENGYCFHLKP
jgi:hypothetical protein